MENHPKMFSDPGGKQLSEDSTLVTMFPDTHPQKSSMVKQTLRKIHFMAYTPRTKHKDPASDRPLTAAVMVKYGTLMFPNRTCTQLGMTGKLVRLFYEPTRKIIGWRVYNTSVSLSGLKDYKLCKPHANSGTWNVSIRGILNEMRGLKEKTYGKLVVKKYVDKDLLNKGDTYYYVQIKEASEANDDE